MRLTSLITAWLTDCRFLSITPCLSSLRLASACREEDSAAILTKDRRAERSVMCLNFQQNQNQNI